jgi:hypothetical protein
MLAPNECFKRIKPIHIGPVVARVRDLEFADSKGCCAWVTKPGSAAPRELLDLVNRLGLGGVTKRMFCRKLMPRQGIAPHVDDWMPAEMLWRRFHVPLVSHPAIVMRWPNDGMETHLEPGYLYEVRFDRMHEVVNGADSERIHIQIDQVDATI